MTKDRCAVCNKTQSVEQLIDYGTILYSMGYIGNKFGHTKCILRVQQRALQFKRRVEK